MLGLFLSVILVILVVSKNAFYGFLIRPKILKKYAGILKLSNYKHYTDTFFFKTFSWPPPVNIVVWSISMILR